MITQANKKGVILQVGHVYRYHPASSKIKSLIGEGRLGKVQYAYGHFMGFKRPRTDVGVTQTDAIDYFDLFNYLLREPPQAVTAVVKNYLNFPLDDTSVSILDYHGKIVFIEAGYMPPKKEGISPLSGIERVSTATSKKILFSSVRTDMRGRGGNVLP